MFIVRWNPALGAPGEDLPFEAVPGGSLLRYSVQECLSLAAHRTTTVDGEDAIASHVPLRRFREGRILLEQ